MAPLADSSSFFAKRNKLLLQHQPTPSDSNTPSNGHHREPHQQKGEQATIVQNDARLLNNNNAPNYGGPTVPLSFSNPGTSLPNRPSYPSFPGNNGTNEMTRMSQAFALEAATEQASRLAAQEESQKKEYETTAATISPPSLPAEEDLEVRRDIAEAIRLDPFFCLKAEFNSLRGLKSQDSKYISQNWKPLAIRATPQLPDAKLAEKPLSLEAMQQFTKPFLVHALGGKEWSPGLFWNPSKTSPLLEKSETYYILDTATEPYLPTNPGDHGAKLSVFFRDFDDGDNEKRYRNFPLFISNGTTNENGETVYSYYGNYSQSRWSDRLDYDRVQEQVPLEVKRYWASLLASDRRPTWATEALLNHFVPKPEYPTTTTTPKREHLVFGNHEREVRAYIDRLEDWFEDKDEFLGELDECYILDAFARADADHPPGLRFYWEYLVCTSFSRSLYQILASQQTGDGGD